MAQVGETSQQAPFTGNTETGQVTLTSFTGADGGFCSDCKLTAYSKKAYGGRMQVLDFAENYQFSLDFCAKSYILDCTRTEYDTAGENEGNSDDTQVDEGEEEGVEEAENTEETQAEEVAEVEKPEEVQPEEAQEEVKEPEKVEEEEEAEIEEEKQDIPLY